MVGCGAVTEVKSGPAFREARDSALVTVMRRNAALAEDYARRHGVPRWTSDAEEVLAADDVDAVYIATHPDTHLEYTLRAAAHGKAVYVEKPMAVDHGQCLRMVDACRAAGVPLWVAYYRRALPRFAAIRESIADGAIGSVLGVHTVRHEPAPSAAEVARDWRLTPGSGPDGAFFDGVCHLFDFLDQLFGPVTEVSGIADNRAGGHTAEDTVAASFRFGSGVIGSGFWCFGSGPRYDTTTVYGSTGRLSFSTHYPQPIRIEQGTEVRELTVADPAHVQQPLIQTIVDELNGQGRCASTGESAARTAWVMDRILAEFRQRWPAGAGVDARPHTSRP
jgi:predicted dehydrogenase